LGCGKKPLEGYLNVDLQPGPGVDVVADVVDLRFSPECFTEINAKDLIEHVSFSDAKRLLRRCFQWLKQGGAIIIHTQNLRFITRILSKGDDHEALLWIYGSDGEGGANPGNQPGEFHRWAYSKERLTEILEAIGFTVIKTDVTCGGFGFQVIAVKRGLNEC